ncbi:MAG TPA: sugar phosphate nucleotidyltransferase [Bryobacteraceae bacterium]|nr:sugar phosphate nucleotidyltransferase [Bryobacteraceae bacterium]
MTSKERRHTVHQRTSSGSQIREANLAQATLHYTEELPVQPSSRWGVILAGGDGTRLLSLTRSLTGDDTPKQFCALGGRETLLDRTRRRVSSVVPSRNTLLLLTRTHERFYARQLSGLAATNLLVQPYNHGTAVAVAYAVTHLHSISPEAIVGFFPSDHHFECEEAFALAVNNAFLHAERDANHVVLIGIIPESAEESYGWIERAGPLPASGTSPVFGVRRFWEKPSKDKARRLMAEGCLWNSFVMVGRVSAFIRMLRRSLPEMLLSFESMWALVEQTTETAALYELFSKVSPSSFSDDVLSICPSDLAVMPLQDAGWTDLGDPERAQATFRLPQTNIAGSATRR